MTLYRLYAHNGNRAGFWVQHRSWSNICARVQSIDGKELGPLPGSAPLHDDAPVVVRGFDVRSGRPVELHAHQQMSGGDRNYVQIAEPYWYGSRC